MTGSTPSAPPQDPSAAMTDPYLVATAYFAFSTAKLALMADILGRQEDFARYSALATKVRAAFASKYLVSPGRLSSDTQTAYSLAIRFGLLPPESANIGGRPASRASGHRWRLHRYRVRRYPCDL